MVGATWGLNPGTQFTNIPDVDGKVFFFRELNNKVSIKLAIGTTGKIEVYDSDAQDTIMCLNNCEGIFISITQQD